MKALIVDDNPSVTAILTEILRIDGHEVFTASNWEDAKRELDLRKPDIMFLDSIVNQKSTIPLVDELDDSIGTKIVLILNGKEQVPRDTSLIIHSIKKPFNSTAVLESMGYVGVGTSVTRAPAEKKTRWFKFLMKSKDGSEMVEKFVSENPIKFGDSYIVYEDSPDAIYEVANNINSNLGELLVITSSRKKIVESRIEAINPTIVTLSRTSREDYIDIRALGTLMGRIMEHIEEKTWPTIVIDDLSQIIINNDLNSVLTMIHQIYAATDCALSIAVSVKESLLTEKDKHLLQRHMKLYKPDEQESKGE